MPHAPHEGAHNFTVASQFWDGHGAEFSAVSGGSTGRARTKMDSASAAKASRSAGGTPSWPSRTMKAREQVPKHWA